MALQQLVQEYSEMPPITRAYTTACVLTTVAVQLEIVTPFQLYFNPTLIFTSFQFWRLITSFCFFGSFGFSFLFNMIFTYRYCRMLEEGSFRGRTADFFVMFVFGGTIMILMALFVNMVFLGQAFTIMLVYIWSRRNPYIRMNFFGLLTFQAPFLPWVLLAFSVLLGNAVIVDFFGNCMRSLLLFPRGRLSEPSGRISSTQDAGFPKAHFRRSSSAGPQLPAITRRKAWRIQLGRRSSRPTESTATTARRRTRSTTTTARCAVTRSNPGANFPVCYKKILYFVVIVGFG